MATQLIKKSMRLFGLPYQFTDAVDPRLDGVSSTVGNKFLQNIIIEGPVCTLIPGEPKYLPGSGSTDKKVSTTAALLEGAASGFGTIKDYITKSTDDDFRLYDFKRSYTKYMQYVNILCRTGATFLELDTKIDGTPLQQYDWRCYRQMASTYASTTDLIVSNTARVIGNATNELASAVKKGVNTIAKTITGKDLLYETGDYQEEEIDAIEDQLANYNFVQFYVDPDISVSETISNSTSESQLKSMFDSGGSFLKEIAFMANSGGTDAAGIENFAASSMESLNTGIQGLVGGTGGIIGAAGTALSRIINLGGNVIKGSNVVMPDIYQSSEYAKSYQITVHLKTPYGTKLGYYLNVFVPMMHLLALALPKETSANTYGSPFMVKAYVEGSFTCNMGMVSDISISRVSDTYTVDGLPSEVDVTLSITDLYSDLSMSPQNSPVMFVNNSSLVEFLATNCGLSIISPNIKARAEMTLNSLTNAFNDIPDSIGSYIKESIDNKIASFTGLTF